MTFFDNDRSTILILKRDQPVPKSFQIKTKHLNRIRHYIALVSLVFLATVGIIIQLNRKIDENEMEKAELLQKIGKLKSQLPEAEAVSNALSYAEQVESKIEKINQYLKKRGVNGITIEKNEKADGSLEENLSESYKLYDDHLEMVYGRLVSMPIGFPGASSTTSSFGYRNNPINPESSKEFHSGLDFRGRYGDRVKSTAGGKVIAAGWKGGYGKCVIVRHSNGYETLYGHLSKITVKNGQKIEAGEIIGNIGSTGRSTGSHLHYEVRKNGKPVNPSKFLRFN